VLRGSVQSFSLRTVAHLAPAAQAEAEAARESGKRDRAAEIAHMQEAILSAVMQA